MTTILIKKKDTAGAPAAGDLTNAAGGAEIAVNTATKRIYTKDSGGAVVETGTNPSILNVDNIQIDVNTISSTDTNGNINLTPNGTGSVVISKLNVTGAITFDGNVTVGNSSSDTLTVNSTITSNLIFTDNTYDIGASGATRPRTLYLGTSLITPSITNSGLTSGRITFASTGGLLVDSANLTFNGTTLTANTIGAFTLGGTIAGGGNQINNVIIGTTTPLAGSFTALSATGVLNLSGVNQIHQLSGHNFLQGDATRTYLYGGTSGIQMRTSNNATALFEMTDAGQFSFSPAGTTTAVISSTGLAVTGALSATGNLTSPTLQLGTNPAGVSVGVLGIPNQKRIYGRNAANSADVNIAYVDGSNGLVFGPGDSVTISSAGNVDMSTGGAILTLNRGQYSQQTKFYQDTGGTGAQYETTNPTVNAQYYAHIFKGTNNVPTTVEYGRFNEFGLGIKGATPSSGSGITFPATQSASSNANTLDDYEEGTWTPTIGASTDPSGIAYSIQNGGYTKIGNVVYIRFRVGFSFTVATGSGALEIRGLPFTSQNGVIHPKSTPQEDNITFTGFTYLDMGTVSNTTTIGLGKNRSGSTAAGVAIGDCAFSGVDVNGGLFYFV